MIQTKEHYFIKHVEVNFNNFDMFNTVMLTKQVNFNMLNKVLLFIPFTTNETIRLKDIFEATIGINSVRNQRLCILVV